MVHREIIRVPKVVPGNLREVHRNLFTRIEVIWHILASRRGHLGPREVISGFMIFIWGFEESLLSPWEVTRGVGNISKGLRKMKWVLEK